MSQPAAILSVVVDASTAQATAKLTQYQARLDAVNATAKKGIRTTLGGTFDDRAFRSYQDATARAARRAADRKAFKAELGANLSSAGFRAYEKQLDGIAAQTAARSAQMRDTMRRNFTQAGQYAAIGIGVAGVAVGKLAIDFDRAMRNVNSIAQLPERQFKALEKSVLSLAGKTAQAPKTLAEGLYDLVSSGFDAKQSMLILASSAKAATAGLTDTATSTHAVAAVLNAYHRPAKDAAAVSDTLFQTVNLGVISFEQLANTIGDVLPFASQLGVGLNQVGAAVSTMTKAGIGPEETMTRLKNVMVAFIKPSQDMAKAIKATGAESGEALIKQKGLQGALEAIVGTTNGTKAALANLFPNIRGLGGALALTGTNAHGAEKDLKQFGSTAGATNKALSQQSQSVSYQWQKFKATLEALGISLADKVIPKVTAFVQQMKDGKGAGGQFVDTIKKGFAIVKTVVHDAVDEFGGLKNTIEVLAGGYAVAKILKFVGAIGKVARGGTGAVAGLSAATGGAGALSKVGAVLSKASWLAYLAPVGLALGVVLDHWIKTNAEAEGKKFANKFLAPMPDSIKQHFEEPLAKASQGVTDAFGKAARNTLTRLQSQGKATTGLGRAGALIPPSAPQAGPSAADAAAIQKAYFTIGQKAGQATVAGLHSVKDVSGPILLQDFLGRLRQLPGMARPEAAKAMLAFAETLQQQGKLPAKAFEAILRSLEAQIPGFDFYLQRQGLASDQAFAKALRFTTATNTLRNTLAGYRTQFGDWQIATKITGSNIVQNMATAMQHLHQTVKSSSGQTRKDAVSELQKLHDQATSLFSSMASKTAQAAKDMRGSITSSTSQAARDASSNLAGLANAIYGGVKSGAINSKQGAQYIQQALNATLKAFGATPIPAVTLKEVALSTPFSANVGAFPKTGQAGGGGKPVGAARGGLMQFGRPGQAGRDSIPLNVGGMPIAVAPGEQVAVFNRHQLPIVNSALAPLGGLPGLFSKVRTPNFMASGGMVNFDGHPGNVSSGVRGLISTMESRFPGLIVTATTDGGHAAGSYHYRGDAVDMASDATTMLSAANYVRTSGLYKSLIEGIHNPNLSVHAGQFVSPSFWGASTWAQHANHIHLAILGALGALAGGIGQISAPQVKGGGTIGRMLRAGLGKVAGAANAYLGSHAGGGDLSGAGLGVGGGGGAGTAANAALWTQAGGPKAVARIAGAIAMAESGGRDIIQQGVDYAHKGWGRWQITPGNSEPQFGIDNALLIPMNNARAAVAKYMTARGGPGFGPWTTYTSGAYRAFLARGGLLGFAGGGLTTAQKKSGHQAIDAIWKRFHNYYPRGAAEPHVQFPATGINSDNPLFAGLQYAYTRPGEHTSFFTPPTVKALLDQKSRLHPWAYKSVLHEFAHDFQNKATLAKEWLREGGASAFASEISPFNVSDTIYNAFKAKVIKQKGWPWVNQGQFGRGGLPFAGSFDAGGVVPGPRGMPSMAVVHGGERITGLAGGGIIGRALAGHPAWRIPLNLPALATIPSQSTSGQIKLQGIQNQLTSAQNTGNVGGQKSALKRILSLEQKWLSADRRQLKKLNKALKQKGLTKKQRQSLLGDKLALLQEIGTVEADIGSTQTSLSDLTSTDTTGTDTTGTDTSGGDTTDPGAQALADAISAQTQALTDATNAINQQTAAINGIGAIEKQQAIKALADVISGQIGGQYYSRATGSAGDGRVARY